MRGSYVPTNGTRAGYFAHLEFMSNQGGVWTVSTCLAGHAI